MQDVGEITNIDAVFIGCVISGPPIKEIEDLLVVIIQSLFFKGPLHTTIYAWRTKDFGKGSSVNIVYYTDNTLVSMQSTHALAAQFIALSCHE